MGTRHSQSDDMTEIATADSGDPTHPHTASGEEESHAEPSARTPFYAALNSDRYRRQDLIREIQAQSEFRLICYVSSGSCRIKHEDAIYFRDLLHRIGDNENVELMLHTPGGDIDAAEKLILMIRDKIGNGGFRIIVPHRAKSAGTLMVLGADTVVMSDTSELGPIDPQVPIPDKDGRQVWVAAQDYIDAYAAHAEALNSDPNDAAAKIMLEKLDPVLRQRCLRAMDRSRKLAEDLLRRGRILSDPTSWTVTASELMDTARWRTHSQVISWRDAKDKKIGLRVDYVHPHDSLWQQYWQLYCLQRLNLKDNEKLFESDYVSLKTACP